MAHLVIRIAVEELLKKTTEYYNDGIVERTRFHCIGIQTLKVNLIEISLSCWFG